MRFPFRRDRAVVPRIWDIPERAVVFVHVPKVATRSMRTALAMAAAGEPEAHADRARELVARAIDSYERFASPRRIASLQRSAFVFGFVRDPLDRLASAYDDKVVRGRADNALCRRHGLRPDVEFREFVRVVVATSDDDCDRHVCSQHRFICHRGRPVVHRIGRFERLHEDWSALRRQLDLPALRHRNPSHVALRRYDLETAELAARRYALDVEMFGYADTISRALG